MLRRTVSYANVMSTLGVFIALGGTSYAVAKLPKNSVDSAQLKAGAVTNAKLAPNAVTRDKLAADALSAGPRGPRGEQGPGGTTGSTGAVGPTGPAGPVDVIVRKHEQYVGFQPNAGATVEALRTTLPAGKWLLHGTVNVINPWTTTTFRCVLVINGTPWGLDQATQIGGGQGDIYTLVGTAESTSPISVVTQCSHDFALSDGGGLPARAERSRLVATRASNIDVQDV